MYLACSKMLLHPNNLHCCLEEESTLYLISCPLRRPKHCVSQGIIHSDGKFHSIRQYALVICINQVSVKCSDQRVVKRSNKFTALIYCKFAYKALEYNASPSQIIFLKLSESSYTEAKNVSVIDFPRRLRFIPYI